MNLNKNIKKELIKKIHDFALNIRKEKHCGQRTIAMEIKIKFGADFSENTVSGWIHRNLIPYANERTQFKPKPVPLKNSLFDLYINQKLSASKIAKIYNVSTIIVINWLKGYKIALRTHRESMSTENVKNELAERKLKRPTNNFISLSPEKAYILGVLSGDGYISNKTIRFEIRNDEEFIEKFSECIEKVYGLKYHYKYYAKRNSLVLYVSSMLITKDLLRYGNFGTFSWNIPNEVNNCDDRKVIAAYLRAIFDSEGSVGNYNINFTTSNHNGASEVSQLLKKVGIDIKLTKIREGKYSKLIISRRENLELFKDFVGFTIHRKMKKLENMYKSKK